MTDTVVRFTGMVAVLPAFLAISCSEEKLQQDPGFDRPKEAVLPEWKEGSMASVSVSGGFKDLQGVIRNPCHWMTSGESILHFNLYRTDELWFEFYPECWAAFPITVTDERIAVLWPPQSVDTKYDFDIVKAIRAISKKSFNGSFIELTLLNDSTLAATYPNKELMRSLAKFGCGDSTFPDAYHVNKEHLRQ